MAALAPHPRLHVTRRGPREGPPVLFVHGICASTRYWTERLGPLEEQFACVVPDLLGHGRSPKPSASAYTLQEHADALEPLLLTLHAEWGRPIPIVAHSMGNLIAFELRRRHPDTIGRILGLSLPTFPDVEAGRRTVAGLNPFAQLVVHPRWYAAPLLSLARLTRGKIGFPWFHKRYRLPRDAWEDGFAVTWPSLSRTLTNMVIATDAPALLAAAGTEDVYWWHGTHDQSAPLHYTQALWAQHGHVPTEVISGGDHNIWIKHNAYFVKRFEELLREAHGGGGHLTPNPLSPPEARRGGTSPSTADEPAEPHSPSSNSEERLPLSSRQGGEGAGG